MCIAVPGTIVSVDGQTALVSWGERRQTVSTLLLPDVAPGEHVIVTGGMIIERLDPGEAAARRQAFDEMLALFDEDRPVRPRRAEPHEKRP